MSELKKNFEKVGGWQLIKQYWKAGVLFYVLFQILLTGASKKSLELVRLGVQLKIKNKLKRKYKYVIDDFDNEHKEDIEKTKSHERKIWMCWMQGLENAPELVRQCYKQIKKNITDREIVLITEENIDEYVSFPSYIQEKYKKGIISHTHFSDLLRLELLCKYGGTWIDSTVLCTGSNIQPYMLDSDLFLFQNLKPGSNGATLNVSNWFITSSSCNRILLATKALLYAYWKENNCVIDYFVFHHFMMIAAERYHEEWNRMIKFPNSIPHVLLLMLFEKFDEDKYSALTNMCPFHKLSNKCSAEDMAKEGTYYYHIMNM